MAERRKDGRMHERRRYTISVAAELVNVHQQTLRHYERLGLVEPFRGKGEIRYYSPQDIEKVQQIRRLIEDLGVNLAGVEVILNMREQMEKLHGEFAEEIRRVRQQNEADVHRLKEIILRLQGAQHEQETPV
jgi:MerR family transcriptional regulator/heat shock protein HspR